MVQDTGMAITLEEIDSFHRFAVEKLGNGGADFTLEECLQMWRADCERAETVEAINRSIGDIEAGRVQTLEEVDAEIRREFGFAPRRR